jgi:hypothetical protein
LVHNNSGQFRPKRLVIQAKLPILGVQCTKRKDS